jgi:hypothetical protein
MNNMELVTLNKNSVVYFIIIFNLLMLVGSKSFSQSVSASQGSQLDYRILATNKTSTMAKELNEAGLIGYRFDSTMGGITANGGKELVVVVSKRKDIQSKYSYKLLATSKTSTMQKELQEAADGGYLYRGQSVYNSAFGGDEVICILERNELNTEAKPNRMSYKVLATTKTSTLQKEVQEASAVGYEMIGMTVSKTAFGGSELVAIMSRLEDQ